MTLPKDLSHGPDIDHRFRTSEAFHLGEALITPSLNRIEMHGAAHQIEPKVMRVLLLLSARPGHVVYRDQILQAVWGQTGDDYLLNRAISELRKIFADSAQKPAYIETIRKTGYRLVAPIKPVASAALVSDKPAPQKDKPSDRIPEAAPPPLPPMRTDQSRHRLWFAGVTGLVGASAIAFVLMWGKSAWFTGPKPYSINHYQVYPATHFPGLEYDPALSPDGSRIAYIADDAEKPAAVFIKMVRGEQAMQLSEGDGLVSSPRWMPDGQGVVYLRLREPTLQFVRVSPMGGAGQIIHEDAQAFGVRGMNIAGDGRQLVYAKRSAPGGAHQLWLLSAWSTRIMAYRGTDS